ncbi:hypothetical protein pb186bvf_018904 [Paramecium bursaria]
MLKFLKKSSRNNRQRYKYDSTKLRGRLLITYHSFSPNKSFQENKKISSKYYDEYMIIKIEMYKLLELLQDYQKYDQQINNVEQFNTELKSQLDVLSQILDYLTKQSIQLEQLLHEFEEDKPLNKYPNNLEMISIDQLEAQIQLNNTLIQQFGTKLELEQESFKELQAELNQLELQLTQREAIKVELEQQYINDSQELTKIQIRLERYLYECKIMLEQKFCIRRETRNFYIESTNEQYVVEKCNRKIIREQQAKDDQMTTQKKLFPLKPKLDYLKLDFIFSNIQSMVKFLDLFQIGSLYRNLNIFHEQCKYLLSSDYKCLYDTQMNPKVQFLKCFDGKDSNPSLITLISDNPSIVSHIVMSVVNLKNFSNQFVSVKDFKFKCYQFQVQNHTPIHQYTLHDQQQIQKYLKNEEQHFFQKNHYLLQFRFQVNDLSFRRINILLLASDLIVDTEIFSDYFRRSYKKVKFEQTPHFGAFIDQIVRQSSKQVVITQINGNSDNIFKLSQGLIIKN